MSSGTKQTTDAEAASDDWQQPVRPPQFDDLYSSVRWLFASVIAGTLFCCIFGPVNAAQFFLTLCLFGSIVLLTTGLEPARREFPIGWKRCWVAYLACLGMFGLGLTWLWLNPQEVGNPSLPQLSPGEFVASAVLSFFSLTMAFSACGWCCMLRDWYLATFVAERVEQ